MTLREARNLAQDLNALAISPDHADVRWPGGTGNGLTLTGADGFISVVYVDGRWEVRE